MINGDASLSHDPIKVSIGQGVTDVKKHSVQDHGLELLHAFDFNHYSAQPAYSVPWKGSAAFDGRLEAQKFATVPVPVPVPSVDKSTIRARQTCSCCEDGAELIAAGRRRSLGDTINPIPVRISRNRTSGNTPESKFRLLRSGQSTSHPVRRYFDLVLADDQSIIWAPDAAMTGLFNLT